MWAYRHKVNCGKLTSLINSSMIFSPQCDIRFLKLAFKLRSPAESLTLVLAV